MTTCPEELFVHKIAMMEIPFVIDLILYKFFLNVGNDTCSNSSPAQARSLPHNLQKASLHHIQTTTTSNATTHAPKPFIAPLRIDVPPPNSHHTTTKTKIKMASSQPSKPPLASQPQSSNRSSQPGLKYPSSGKTIYHRPLNRSRTQELSQASFAYLFGEMVSYAQKRVTGIQDLEKRYVCLYIYVFKLKRGLILILIFDTG